MGIIEKLIEKFTESNATKADWYQKTTFCHDGIDLDEEMNGIYSYINLINKRNTVLKNARNKGGQGKP